MQSYTRSHILLQGFNWNSWRRHNKQYYRYMQTKSKSIKDAGIDGVWFPPPTKSVSPQGYMPLNLYDLSSEYGSEEELKACIDIFHNDDIDVYADVVLNHRCAEFQNEHGVYNVYGGPLAWDATAIVGNDLNFQGKGNHKDFSFFNAAPNIDHSQEYVRNDLIAWMKWLKNCYGFDGFRFDFVTGFDGKYIEEYVVQTNSKLVIGEYWDSLEYSHDGQLEHNQDSHRQRIVNWIDQTGGKATAFDMTLKGILQTTFQNGGEYWRLKDSNNKIPSVIGWWGTNAVTFLDNHDTHCDSQNHWPFPNHYLIEGYAYILTHPGTPMIYWDHFMTPYLESPLSFLIAMRKEYDIGNDSKVEILQADNCRYMAKIDDKLIFVIGDKSNIPSNIIFESKNVAICEICINMINTAIKN